MNNCLTCNNETKNKYCSRECYCIALKNGKYPQNGFPKGHKSFTPVRTEEEKSRISTAIKDKWLNDIEYIDRHKEGSKKQSEKMKDKFQFGEIKIWNKGLTKESDVRIIKYSEKCSKTKTGKCCGENNPFYGKHHDEEVIKKIRQKSIEMWECLTEEELEERYRKMLRRRNKSGSELLMEKIINENNLPFYFNGYAQNRNPIVIGRKIPDFVHNTENMLIEIWGDYWHKGENPQDKIDFFKQQGYDCLVFWASELNNKEEILHRIRDFSEVLKF